jgi:hypothetical protein
MLNKYVGKNVLVWVGNFTYTGKVKSVTDNFMQLEQVSWVADMGRPSKTIHNSEFNEIEYMGIDMDVNILHIETICEITTLPTKTV